MGDDTVAWRGAVYTAIEAKEDETALTDGSGSSIRR
jgi:hypothetical protein